MGVALALAKLIQLLAAALLLVRIGIRLEPLEAFQDALAALQPALNALGQCPPRGAQPAAQQPEACGRCAEADQGGEGAAAALQQDHPSSQSCSQGPEAAQLRQQPGTEQGR